MTQDEIIEMARQASTTPWCYMPTTLAELKAFANLVAVKQREVSATFIEELDERGFKELAALIRKKGLTND